MLHNTYRRHCYHEWKVYQAIPVKTNQFFILHTNTLGAAGAKGITIMLELLLRWEKTVPINLLALPTKIFKINIWPCRVSSYYKPGRGREIVLSWQGVSNKSPNVLKSKYSFQKTKQN